MERPRVDLVPAIGVFKLVKATLLLAVGLALLLEVPQQLGAQLEGAVQRLGIGAGRRTVQAVIEKVWSLDDGVERKVAIFALAYAAIFSTEGVGLLLRRRWAEWLTVVVTASFIPFELYELVHHFGPAKLVALAVNVAIVVYLVRVRLAARRPPLRAVTA